MNTTTIEQVTPLPPKRKSVALTIEERKWLRKHMAKFDTTVEAAEDIGVPRQFLERILLTWSASPTNVEIIQSRKAKDESTAS